MAHRGSNTKKKVLIGLVIILVLIGGGVFLLFSNLDKIVETGIETAGSSALGSRVEVGSVAMISPQVLLLFTISVLPIRLGTAMPR